MNTRAKKPDLPQVLFQMKVILRDIEPEIWRSILIPGAVTLDKLHKILQILMGWESGHLYSFSIGDSEYGVPNAEFDTDFYDSRRVKLEKAVGRKKKFIYLYDFGDNWEHEIRVEKMLKGDKGQSCAVCLGGERACPPEDVGGTGGYEDFLAACFDPSHEEHEDIREWAEDDFDP